MQMQVGASMLVICEHPRRASYIIAGHSQATKPFSLRIPFLLFGTPVLQSQTFRLPKPQERVAFVLRSFVFHRATMSFFSLFFFFGFHLFSVTRPPACRLRHDADIGSVSAQCVLSFSPFAALDGASLKRYITSRPPCLALLHLPH